MSENDLVELLDRIADGSIEAHDLILEEFRRLRALAMSDLSET